MNQYTATWEFYKKDDNGLRRLVGSATMPITAENYAAAYEIAQWLHTVNSNFLYFSNVIFTISQSS